MRTRLRPRRWLRSAATLFTATMVTIAATLIPATAASAAADGNGWSGSWNYYTENWIHLQATVPGVALDAYLSDYGGSRKAQGWLSDTVIDGECARVALFASDVGYFVDTTVCDGGGTVYFPANTTFSGALLAWVYRQPPGGGQGTKAFYQFLPSSVGDPDLRKIGTGVSWSYYASSNFQFEVRREGVRHAGFGGVAGGNRWASGALEVQAPANCVSGRLSSNVSVSGTVCGSGQYTILTRSDFASWILAEACQTSPGDRCIAGYIPDPH